MDENTLELILRWLQASRKNQPPANPVVPIPPRPAPPAPGMIPIPEMATMPPERLGMRDPMPNMDPERAMMLEFLRKNFGYRDNREM